MATAVRVFAPEEAPQILTHYTAEAGMKGITSSETLNASLDPLHARFGPGQYLTNIGPDSVGARSISRLTPEQISAGKISLGQLARRPWGQPWVGGRVGYYVNIDVSGLNFIEEARTSSGFRALGRSTSAAQHWLGADSGMKSYYRRAAESDLGEGVAYIEFDGEWATRQVEIYGDRWFDSRTAFHDEIGPGLCDQPLSEMGMLDEEEITAEEFERIWAEAVVR